MATKKQTKHKKTAQKQPTNHTNHPVGKIITIVVVTAIALIAVSSLIVVNDCASPCRYDDRDGVEPVSCPTVCEKETLLQRILWIFHKKSSKKDSFKNTDKIIYISSNETAFSDLQVVADKNKDVTIRYSSQVQCIKAPCSDITVENTINFPEDDMGRVYDFINKYVNENKQEAFIEYDTLNYKDKRLLASMMANDSTDINLYRVRYRTDDIEYTLEKNHTETFTIQKAPYGERAEYLNLTREDQERGIKLVENICERLGEYDFVINTKHAATEEELQEIHELINIK